MRGAHILPQIKGLRLLKAPGKIYVLCDCLGRRCINCNFSGYWIVGGYWTCGARRSSIQSRNVWVLVVSFPSQGRPCKLRGSSRVVAQLPMGNLANHQRIVPQFQNAIFFKFPADSLTQVSQPTSLEPSAPPNRPRFVPPIPRYYLALLKRNRSERNLCAQTGRNASQSRETDFRWWRVALT